MCEGVEERVGVAGRVLVLVGCFEGVCGFWGVLGRRLGLGLPLVKLGAGDRDRGAVLACRDVLMAAKDRLMSDPCCSAGASASSDGNRGVPGGVISQS